MAKKKQRTPRLVEHVSDSEDEEIPEDEAFNSDDERKYGAFFETNHSDGKRHDHDDEVSSSDEGSDDGFATDDEDEEGDGGQYMLDLLSKLDSGPKDDSLSRKTHVASHVAESEFAASVVQNSQLTIDALMEGLEDTQGFGRMQQTMSKVVNSHAPAVPVAKPVADRAQRKVHYEHETQEVSRWMEAVQENRQAETLDFRHKERLGDVTKEQLVEKFVPTTDFEKELHEALMNAGQQDEEAILKREEALLREDDLGSSTLTMEDYQKRRGELAKMRALMFYHEQKRHHMKKIKSKKYRRIRKRQRQRQKEAEVNLEMEDNHEVIKEMEEKEQVERMKERMTLAHKNTSKWAKRILKRGKNVDVDTRRALSAQLKQGDNLRKKMNSTRNGAESSDDDDNENLVDMARKVLEDAEDGSQIPLHNKGLFKLSFMQKGIEAQREKAKEEARQLLGELESNEDLAGSDDEVQESKETQQRRGSRKVASEAEMKDLISEGNLVAKSLEFGNHSSIAVTGGIDIDIPVVNAAPSHQLGSREAVSQHSTTMEVEVNAGNKKIAADGAEQAQSADRRITVGYSTSANKGVDTSGEEANPWMPEDDPALESAHTSVCKQTHRKSQGKKNDLVDVESAIDVLARDRDDGLTNGSECESVEIPDSDKQIAKLTQEQLLRRAFAAPDEQVVERAFAQEKQAMKERDDPTRRKAQSSNKSVSGWGSWAGEGAPAAKPRKLPTRLQPPEMKLSKRKRQDEKKPHIIINEKRQKKTVNQFQISKIPYPYTSREEYERAMAGGVGREWNASNGVKSLTRPAIMTRAGKIIQPISKKAKQKRPAAKF